jgi:hypothetical protein
MAYMAAQFLKGGKSYHPVKVNIVDKRMADPESFFDDLPSRTGFNKEYEIVYELDCRDTQGSRQELCLNQLESEYLIEGLLLKTALNISNEDKLELIKILSFKTKKEVIEYLGEEQDKLKKKQLKKKIKELKKEEKWIVR